jgi:hypothetical protein
MASEPMYGRLPEFYLQRFPGPMFRYLESIQPRLEIERMLFSHREVYVDPHDVVELWDFHGEKIDNWARAQTALNDQRVTDEDYQPSNGEHVCFPFSPKPSEAK